MGDPPRDREPVRAATASCGWRTRRRPNCSGCRATRRSRSSGSARAPIRVMSRPPGCSSSCCSCASRWSSSRLVQGGGHSMFTWRVLIKPMLEWMTPQLATNVKLVRDRDRRLANAAGPPGRVPARHRAASASLAGSGGSSPGMARRDSPARVVRAPGASGHDTSMRHQHWLARLSFLLMAGALTVLIVFAGWHSFGRDRLHPARHLREHRRRLLVPRPARLPALGRVRAGDLRPDRRSRCCSPGTTTCGWPSP